MFHSLFSSVYACLLWACCKAKPDCVEVFEKGCWAQVDSEFCQNTICSERLEDLNLPSNFIVKDLNQVTSQLKTLTKWLHSWWPQPSDFTIEGLNLPSDCTIEDLNLPSDFTIEDLNLPSCFTIEDLNLPSHFPLGLWIAFLDSAV